MSDPLDSQRLRCKARVDLPLLGEGEDIVKGFVHDALKLLFDIFLVPVEGVEVLHPLKVGDGDSTSVSEDVGDDDNAALVEDLSLIHI